MKKFGMALLAVLAVNSAFGAEWVSLGKAKNENQNFYLDVSSVHESDSNSQIISYVGKASFSKPVKVNIDGTSKNVKYIITKFKGDCRNNKTFHIESIAYSPKNIELTTVSNSFEKWEDVLPESARAGAFAKACKIAGYN